MTEKAGTEARLSQKAPSKLSGLLPVEETRSIILERLPLLDTETVPLQRAIDRVSGEDVRALVSYPSFPASAMDGYALRSGDVHQLPVRLRQIGISRAGERFHGTLAAGTCVRIFTGANVPAGADIIVLQECASAKEDDILINEVPKKGAHIRRAGLDFSAGQVCIAKGRLLSARDIDLITSCGHARISVRRTPSNAH